MGMDMFIVGLELLQQIMMISHRGYDQTGSADCPSALVPGNGKTLSSKAKFEICSLVPYVPEKSLLSPEGLEAEAAKTQSSSTIGYIILAGPLPFPCQFEYTLCDQ